MPRKECSVMDDRLQFLLPNRSPAANSYSRLSCRLASCIRALEAQRLGPGKPLANDQSVGSDTWQVVD
jgi:hypothetical protein